ncbi:MAG: transporter [Thiobacillus sp.]|nr:transporter [Thiobacillus sp.]
MTKKGAWARAGLVVMLGTQAAHAQTVQQPRLDAAAPQPDLAQLRQQVAAQALKLAEQQRQLDESNRQLGALQKQLEALQQRLGAAPAQPAQAATAAQPPTRVSQVDARATDRPVGQAPVREDTRPPEIAPLFEAPGVLSPRGRFTLEPSLQYSYSSSDRVSIVGYTIIPALVIGLIDVRSVQRTTVVAGLTARYGLTNRLEVEGRIPYVYRNDDTVSRPINLEPSSASKVFNAEGSGLGDVELAGRYQINMPKPGNPYFIGGLRLKARTGEDPFEVDYLAAAPGLPTLQTSLPTGSGFYSLQPSLSMIYPTDPAVFFGGINYQWNIKRDVNKSLKGLPTSFVGEVDPGDAIGINFGMGLGLNERSSFSIGYEHTWIGKTKTDGTVTEGTTSLQTASLLLGYSYRLNKQASLSLSVGAGLTNDSPDTQFTLRLPYTF